MDKMIFTFISCSPGVPQSFQTASEMCKFVTMMIFSCSALHAAVNFSQVFSLINKWTAVLRNSILCTFMNSIQMYLTHFPMSTFSWIITFGYRTLQRPCHAPLLRPKTQCLRRRFSPSFRM